jgi:hypothetical protein
MHKDKIVEEVRRARERYAARFGFNLNAIYRDLRDRQATGEFRVVHRPPRRPRGSGRAIHATRIKATRG